MHHLARPRADRARRADGSAFFEVPALRSLFFVALNEQDLSVKRMQSFVTVQPGEVTGCMGCHEPRTHTFPAQRAATLAAMRRPPSLIAPIPSVPPVIDFPRDVQPVLDRHCVRCHGPGKAEGKIELSLRLISADTLPKRIRSPGKRSTREFRRYEFPPPSKEESRCGGLI